MFDISMQPQTLMSGAQAIAHWARKAPDSIAVTEGARRHTFADAEQHLARLVQALAAEGVGPGMIVGVWFAGRYMQLLLLLACEVLGATHLSLGDDEATADAPIAHRCQMFLVEGPNPNLCTIGKAVNIDAAFVGRALAAALSLEARDRLGVTHDPAIGVRIASSSGTTGEPKRMLKTRGMIDAIIESYDHVLKPVDGPFRYYCLYSAALGGVYLDIIRALKFGNEIVFTNLNGFVANPNKFLTYALILPREADLVLAHCRRQQINLNLYYVDIAGAGVDEAFHAALEAHISPEILNIYSSNEMSVIARLERGSLYSLARGVEVEIVDDQGRVLPLGEQGLIRVRTPYAVKGYLWNEALTVSAFDDGWFHMNDVGVQPEPGKLRVLGRADDMLNIGGEKLSPYPIEAALTALAGVRAAVVLRAENTFGVGTLAVVVEPQPDADREALRALIDKTLRPLKRPYALHFETNLPRTETGKVRRAALQALLPQRAAEPGLVSN